MLRQKIENMISREGVALEEEKIQDILGKVLEKEPVGLTKMHQSFCCGSSKRK